MDFCGPPGRQNRVGEVDATGGDGLMFRHGARTWVAIARRSLLAMALVAATGLAGFALSASGQGSSGGDVGVVAHSDTEVDQVAASGAGWVAWVSSWSRLEPTNGVYSVSAWDALEAHLQHAKAQGLRVELTLTGAPSWANGGFAGTGVPPTPANYPRYASFLKALAKRMGPLVDAWIVWNEPNHPNYWATPDAVEYTRLLKAAYPAIKSADPTSTVLLGPLAPTGPGLNGNGGSGAIDPYTFLTSVYAAGIRGYADALAWNLYPPGAPEDTFTDSSGHPYAGSFPGQLYVHSLLQSLDPGLHVWVTEFGWSTCVSCQLNLINGVDEPTQADYLGRAWTYERRYLPWVDVMFWFEAQDSNSSPSTWERGLGLLRNDGSAKPAYQALGVIANQSGGGGGGGTGTGTGGGGGGGTGTGTTTTVKPKPPKVCSVPSVRALEGQGGAERRRLHPEARTWVLQPQLRRRHNCQEGHDGCDRRPARIAVVQGLDAEAEAKLARQGATARPRVHPDSRAGQLEPREGVPRQSSGEVRSEAGALGLRGVAPTA